LAHIWGHQIIPAVEEETGFTPVLIAGEEPVFMVDD
jgi:hypothetical protein